MAIEKDLLKTGAERLGILSDGRFEQALLPKPAILLPSVPAAPSLRSVGTSVWKRPGEYPSAESRRVAGRFLGRVPHSTAQSLCHPRRERGGTARSQGPEKGRVTFSHGTAELESWLNCLKVAISHWINTAEGL